MNKVSSYSILTFPKHKLEQALLSTYRYGKTDLSQLLSDALLSG